MNNHIKNNNEHNFLYYYKKYLYCHKHILEYVSYCSQCKCNLCEKCEKEHENHENKIILYKKEKEKLDDKTVFEIQNKIKEKFLNIKKIKDEINTMNYLFDIFIKKLDLEIDNYHQFYIKMFLLSNNLNNFENIKNLKNIFKKYNYK